jgi:quercetin dioxygenase-like cupin family protein
MSNYTAGPLIGPVGALRPFSSGDVTVAPLLGPAVDHDAVGTMFVVTLEPAHLDTAAGAYPIPACGYAVLPAVASVRGGLGVAVVHRQHRGLFSVGGPVEHTGRLTYIDGCSDTVLVAPVVRGDPCLNLLVLPAGTRQTDHHHPSDRIGLVLSGHGTCVVGGPAERHELGPGVVFSLPAGATHRFETTTSALRLVAWHPDSDVGPTEDDHPMLNRTLRPGTTERVR